MKILSPSSHGVVDYAAVLALLVLPSVFDFSNTPATLCYVVAATQLVVSLLTRYPLGLIKKIPFPIHGYYELVSSLLLVPLPWLFGFSNEDAARNFFVISGLSLFVVWLVTNYRAVPADAQYELGNRAAHLH
jgi:hypothetical protein